jgi:hypothetical protein
MIDAVILGFYSKLATYSASYRTHHIIAPKTAVVPYVTYGLATDRPVAVFGNLEKIEEVTFWINCFGSSPAQVQDIVDLVLAVMDNATLTVAGYSSMVCRREFMGAMIADVDASVYQVPLRYRIMVCEN